jgi:hypothetical protein
MLSVLIAAADEQQTRRRPNLSGGAQTRGRGKGRGKDGKVRSQCLRLKNVFVRSLEMFGLAACLRF